MTNPQNPVSAPGWQQPGAPVPPQQYPPAPGRYAPQGQFQQQAPAGYQQGPGHPPYQQAPYQQGGQPHPQGQGPQGGQPYPQGQGPQGGQPYPGQQGGQPYPQGQYQQAPYQQVPYQQQGGFQQRELSGDFIKHTGMLIWWQQSTRTTSGTFEQVAEAYKSAQLHNLLAGWWSISSAIAFNWWAIFRNMYEFSKVKKAAGR